MVKKASQSGAAAAILQHQGYAEVLRAYRRGYDIEVGESHLVTGYLVGTLGIVLDDACHIAQSLAAYGLEYCLPRLEHVPDGRSFRGGAD